jgi:Zc3h12a-like Ribonuclease NYN domain
MDRKFAVVDGSNIATEGRSTPSLAQLDRAVREFQEQFPDTQVIVVVDATFGHRIDPSERAAFDEAMSHGELVSPPAGAIGRGDAFLLRVAERVGAEVLSNDSFQEFHGEHPWLFDAGRLIGGIPVQGVGWIFVPRSPVKGPRSRAARKAVEGAAKLSKKDGQPVSTTRPAKTKEPAKTAKPAKTVTAAKTVTPSKSAKRTKTQPDVKPTKSVKPAKSAKPHKSVEAAKAEKPAKLVKAAKPAKPEKPAAPAKAATQQRSAASPKQASSKKATPQKARPQKASPKATAKEAKKKSASTGPSRTALGGAAEPGGLEEAIEVATEEVLVPPDQGVAPVRRGARRGPGPPPAVNDPLTFLSFVAEHPLETEVDGTVSAFTSHGAMVDVGDMHCYVPLAGLGDPPPARARDVLEKGEIRTFVLKALDAPRRSAELALAWFGASGQRPRTRDGKGGADRETTTRPRSTTEPGIAAR